MYDICGQRTDGKVLNCPYASPSVKVYLTISFLFSSSFELIINIVFVVSAAWWSLFRQNTKSLSNHYWECLLYRDSVWHFEVSSSTGYSSLSLSLLFRAAIISSLLIRACYLSICRLFLFLWVVLHAWGTSWTSSASSPALLISPFSSMSLLLLRLDFVSPDDIWFNNIGIWWWYFLDFYSRLVEIWLWMV